MKLNELAVKFHLAPGVVAFCLADTLAVDIPVKEDRDYLMFDWREQPFLDVAALRIARHPDFQDVIDTAEAARRCGCGASTIRRWLKDGEIKPVRKARPLARIGKNGGSQTYYWKHGDIAVAALRHGVYKPPQVKP